MTQTAARRADASRQKPAALAAQQARPRRRRRRMAAGVAAVAVLGAGTAGAWRAGALSPAASRAAGTHEATATRPVVRANIAATMPVTATLGYAGTYIVRGQGGGTLTWLPSAGQVISQGQVLYKTGNGAPVVLLYGTVPDWRALSEGVTGADVAQLNHDLVALGFASSADITAVGWDYFSSATAAAVQRLEERLGVSFPPGSLALGQVVFEPAALRVAQVTGALGGPAAGPVLQATSDQHVVTIALDVSQESEVKAGDTVRVTLPDGTSTRGVVSRVGTVATAAPASQATQGEGQGPATTIPVLVRLTDPAAAGTLDQAPVTVNITTATAHDVLAVPVTALLARPGGYDVEVAGPHGSRKYVPVTPGIFDDNSGMVQVTGNISPGQRVVVASS
ncbi:MAG: peptidoglycan-binding protein [Actinobacteria bacterium]|nr:peptidoglycan-binding protein [Actinomycetota bacterium]